MEAAVRVAQAAGFVAAELRALANLSAILAADDPRRSNQVATDALALARRVGHRMSANWLVSNVMVAAFFVGRGWEEATADGEEALAAGPDQSDELRILTYLTLIRLGRGDPVDETLERLGQLARLTSDPGDMQFLHVLRAIRLIEAGDLDRAYEEAFGAVDLFSAFAAACLRIAARAALMAGSLERAREVAARLDLVPGSDRDIQLLRAATQAGVAALEGRGREAIDGYRRVVRADYDRGEDFEAAAQALQLVLLVGASDPAVRDLADEARAVFERVGARPWLARLDAALAGPPVATAGTAPAPAAVDAAASAGLAS